MEYQRFAGLPLISGKTGLALLSLLAMTACQSSSLPVAQDYPTIRQPMIESAAQWQQIADEIWTQVDTTLKNGGYTETSISLEPPAQQTQFTKAMDGFLFTEAVSHGVNVAPRSDFTLTYNVQIVHYEPLTDEQPSPSKTGNDGWDDSDTTTEMILTISVTDDHSVRIRESKVFYIDDADIGLYMTKDAASSAEMKISNSGLVSSNWYADNPHDVEPIARHDANSFALMVDPVSGPIHSVNEATPIAAAHCAKVGMSEAKYIGQSYPTNDRKQIRLQYECL